MTTAEFAEEQRLEQEAEAQELRDIQELDRTPNWAWPDEEPSNFYTGYKGKTLKQFRDDINMMDLSL